MPLYEYECAKCKHRFEHIQKFSDPLIEVCPECGGKVEQMISAPAVQFKGSGWYVTDYARKGAGGSGAKKDSGSRDSASSENKSGEKTESKSSSNTESKGESKSESKPTTDKK